MSLRDRQWRRFLTAPDQELISELYEPAMREAVQYDRCCSYFSSSVLAAAARGFAPFVERMLLRDNTAAAPTIRLLVNEELSRADVDAMLHAPGADALARRLAQHLLEPQDALERERLALLGLLVKRGLLDVRVGVMRSGRGILHSKFGLITDSGGDAVVFSGSGNETASGLSANFETLEVTTSWDDKARHDHFRNRFEELWRDESALVSVVTLPIAVRDRLIRYASAEPISRPARSTSVQTRRQRLESWMRWRFTVEAPWLPAGARNSDAMAPVSLWPHQIRVVEETAAAWPAGRLLCDEVGMGKTIEAIMILRRLLAGRGVRRALLLVPAGILKQWQGELHEKGGLLVPRLEGHSTLVWPDGRQEIVSDLAAALEQPLLLMSREMARLEQNASVLLEAHRWDLVLLDEAHAARRASQEETEFNSATLLLDLLRQMQLKGRARGILLLSATPMQTHPWEPWDLLAILGEGAPWLADFGVVRSFYEGLAGAETHAVPMAKGRAVAATVASDGAFPQMSVPVSQLPSRLFTAPGPEREGLVTQLRSGAPLGRRMHRNTRATLRSYYAAGLIDCPPAEREIQDVRYDFEDHAERDLYGQVQTYVERRFTELENERPGKGFVMTVYRRRAASSPAALKCSLGRRKTGLEAVVRGAAPRVLEDLDGADRQDFDELLGESRSSRSPSSLPEDPNVARHELTDVNRLLRLLDSLGATDSKLQQFIDALEKATDDGRPCLVFSEFTDTVDYLREQLFPRYGAGVACYTGRGGSVWREDAWRTVTKETITSGLAKGEIRILLCSDAASEGLNLQFASALINYDLPWNPARVEQRIGRIDRIGQTAAMLRIVNLILADSVDERVYQVLSNRCDLFHSYVGAMQPVLSVARQMLLGVQNFSAAVLEAVADAAKGDVLAEAAFRETDALPPAEPAPGVTLPDLIMAYRALGRGVTVDTAHGIGTLAADAHMLAGDPALLPLSPFVSELRTVGHDLREPGELPPLVVESVEEEAFRVVVAIWAGGGEIEVLDRAERLEALLGTWDGQLLPPEVWKIARANALDIARQRVRTMSDRAAGIERAGLKSQVDAARHRLLRELARFLLAAGERDEDLNRVFHTWMQRAGQSGELLKRSFELVGYPEWSADILRMPMEAIAGMTTNQRKNILLGTPLEAALKDPRWTAAATLHLDPPR